MRSSPLSHLACQRGMTIIAPLILLLTAATLVVHATAERSIRVQQYQAVQRVLIRHYTDATSTLNVILGTLRTATPLNAAAQLSFANAKVSTHPQSLPSGSPVTAYRVSYDGGDTPGIITPRIHMDAIRYSMLKRLPEAAFISTTVLPTDARITVWDEAPPLTIATKVHDRMPEGQIRQCVDTRPQPCPIFPLTQLSTPSESVLLQLFNREVDAISPDDFIAAARVDHCRDLATDVARVVWVTGDCHLNVDQSVGERDRPVLLFIENGDLRLSPSSSITGMVILLQRDSALPIAITIAPSARVVGSMINTAPLSHTVQLYLTADPTVLETLQGSAALAMIALIPGSWRDFE